MKDRKQINEYLNKALQKQYSNYNKDKLSDIGDSFVLNSRNEPRYPKMEDYITIKRWRKKISKKPYYSYKAYKKDEGQVFNDTLLLFKSILKNYKDKPDDKSIEKIVKVLIDKKKILVKRLLRINLKIYYH